jgi:aldose 1-epimerase
MILLQNARSRCIIDPHNGGMITVFDCEENPILYAPAKPKRVGGFAWHGCWPLVPFANRAFDGLIATPDGPIHVPINDAQNSIAMHGFSALASWRVVERTDQTLRILDERKEGDDPFRYIAEQQIALDESGALTVILSVENTAEQSLPYGLGLHPWFPCDADTRFAAQASHVVNFSPSYRAIGSMPVDAETDWRKPRILKGKERVANFLDWDGTALLRYPSRGYGIKIKASHSLRFGLLWTPGDTDFVCFEPQSHVIGAPSEPAAAALSPMALLKKGERISGTMRISHYKLDEVP